MRIVRNHNGGVVVTMPLQDVLELMRLDQYLYRMPSGAYIWLYGNGLVPQGAQVVATPLDFLQELPTLCEEVNSNMMTSIEL